MKTLAALLFVATAFATGQDVPAHYQEVGQIVGKAGTLNGDGSFRINLPRTDVKFTNAANMPIPADMGLSTYIALNGNAEQTLAVGDVAMLAGEIDGVIDTLMAGGYEIVSVHNHMTTESPRLFFMHFQATGKPQTLAKTFRAAIDLLGKPAPETAAPSGAKPVLDAEALGAVFGAKAQVFPSGVLRFATPRKDVEVALDGSVFLPGMGLGSWAAFHACECGMTMVMGDTCCLRSDLQAVIREYRKAGIHITAIHHHILGGSREVMFMHFEAEGEAGAIAKGIKAGWNALGKG